MFRGFINNAMKMNKYNIRIRTFANATNNNNSKIGLSQVVPSNISVVSAVKKKKQAITNVLFSFLTCVLGAQVIRYRYMKDEVDDEDDANCASLTMLALSWVSAFIFALSCCCSL